MAFPKSINQLCTPAMLYFTISIISLGIILIQNIGYCNSYHVGSFSCSVPSTTLIFIIKLTYILFWTWILNLICKDGHSGISWLLILLPFILFFVMIGILMTTNF
jgi:hypothetical protein